MNSDLPLLRQAQPEPSCLHGCGHTGFTGTSIYFSTESNIGAVALTNRLFFPPPSRTDLSEFRRAA